MKQEERNDRERCNYQGKRNVPGNRKPREIRLDLAELSGRRRQERPRGTQRSGRKYRRHRRGGKRVLAGLFLTAAACGILIFSAKALFLWYSERTTEAEHPDWTQNFLTVNPYSRPGVPLFQVKDIFVHYTANPGTNAVQNRSYFEQLKDTHERSASAHFIIGYEGDILQCIPLSEIGYAVKTRNEDSVSIECCYINEDGSFTRETYDSLIELLCWLLKKYHLDTDHILRHYDCGGKKCPLYYTEHEDAWEQLKQDVALKMQKK